MGRKKLKKAWFKRHQKDGIYNYYEVNGVDTPEKNYDAYVQGISFLADIPSIWITHNRPDDPTGTWCHWEVSEPITQKEYEEAYQKALNHPEVRMR